MPRCTCAILAPTAEPFRTSPGGARRARSRRGYSRRLELHGFAGASASSEALSSDDAMVRREAFRSSASFAAVLNIE